jgi:hypothetical protein
MRGRAAAVGCYSQRLALDKEDSARAARSAVRTVPDVVDQVVAPSVAAGRQH